MKFLKAIFNSIMEWVTVAMIAIIAVTAWNNYTQPKENHVEEKPVFDVYARDNTSHLI